MLIATTLLPDEQEENFKCEVCDISYSPEHYLILLNEKKIAYFTVEQSGSPQEPIEGVPVCSICHNCFYDLLTNVSNGELLKIKLIYQDVAHVCAFDPDSGDTII
tara:strand:+ start:141 stop:455 length:315 start_codon:yes stop_codon:yes gene_type:complete